MSDRFGTSPQALVSTDSGVKKAVLEPVQRRILESHSFLHLSSMKEGREGLHAFKDYSREIVVRRRPVDFNFFHIG